MLVKAYAIIDTSFYLEKALADLLKGLPTDKLLISVKETAVVKEKKELLKTAFLLKHSKIPKPLEAKWFKKRIKKIVRDYSWLGCRFFEGAPKKDEDYYKIVTELAKDNPKVELRRIERIRASNLREREKLIKKLHLTPLQKFLVACGAEIVFLRTYRLELINQAMAILEPLIREIAIRLGISKEFLTYMAPQEIISSLLKKKLIIPLRILRCRQEGYAAYLDERKRTIIVCGEQIKLVRHKENLESRYFSKIFEIKGNPVFPGRVKGRVKILYLLEEKDKFQKGDVLVVRMTTPDWVPILEKAVALVTDEGGITCHAAIVSRELGIPCIKGWRFGRGGCE